MAGYHNTKKLRTYRSLYHGNRCFSEIVHHCWILEQAGFVPIVKMKIFRGLVRELQSQISHDVVDHMHEIEDQDMFEFGKVRIAWEQHLNPERPAFREGGTNDRH